MGKHQVRNKNLSFILTGLIVLIFGFTLPINGQEGPDGESLYTSRCLGCHKLGGGDSIGPDLLGITEQKSLGYLVAYTIDPASMEDSSEHVHSDAFSMAMPPMSMSEEDVTAIYEYISSLSDTSADEPVEAEVEEPEVVEEVEVTEELEESEAESEPTDDIVILDGESLYVEKCGQCHTIGGGSSIGPDLIGITGLKSLGYLVAYTIDPASMEDSDEHVHSDEFSMPMPPMSLSEEEVTAIYEHISSFGDAPADEPVEDGAGEPEAEIFAKSDTSYERGESLFADMCSVCHSIGGGRTIGSDLAGITRVREKDWLIRVLVDPSIYDMPMPDFGLDEAGAEAIYTFLNYIDVPPEGFTESIGKPVEGTVAGEGEVDAVLDYIFGSTRADQPKEPHIAEPQTWGHLPVIARILVICAVVIFVVFLLSVMSDAAKRKKPLGL